MAKGKKYYWLKLKRDFFKRHDVRIIEEMPNGKDYILFYLKMLLESIDHGGELRFNETIPYNEQMLSIITNTNIDLVRSAMKVFIQLKMVEILDDETIYMTEVQKMTGTETAWAEKKRLYRGKDKLRTMSSLCPPDVRQEIELEKEIDTELEKDVGTGAPAPAPSPGSGKAPQKHKYGEYQNVLLSDADLAKLKEEFPDWALRIERLSEYIASKGAKYKNHLATIRAWARKDKEHGSTGNKLQRPAQANQRESRFDHLGDPI